MQIKWVILIIAVCLSLASYLFAHEGMEHDEGMELMDHEKNSMMDSQDKMTTETKAVEVGNKICPVSGDEIPAPGEKGDMGEAIQYEYNGKIYNLCCPMCVKDFKKNPEKYSKIAEDEVAKDKMMEENQEGQK